MNNKWFNEIIKKIKGVFKASDDQSYKNESEADGSHKNSKSKKHDLIAKILCVVLATFLWFYVIDEQSPTSERTFSDIPVTFANSSKMAEGFAVISGHNYSVDVVLSGKRSDLNRISSSDILASVDLSGIQSAGEYPLNISIISPSNTAVKSQTPGSLYVYVDKTITRTFEIKCAYTGGTSDNESLILGTLTPSRNYITVTGPEEEVLKVSHGLVNLSLGVIDKTVRLREKVVLVDANSIEIDNPYIKTDITDVDVSVPVYKIKEVPVHVNYKHGYFDAGTIKEELYPSTVTIKGPVDLINTVDKIETEPFDEQVMESSVSLQLACSLPAGVSFYGSETKISAKFTVDNFSKRTFVINRSNIIIQNPSDEFDFEIINEAVDIQFSGVESYLSGIYPGTLRVYVDASSITAPGTYKEVPLIISRPAKNVFVSNENECKVDVIVK